MKKSRKNIGNFESKKLNLEKLNITKLHNMGAIRGGDEGETVDPDNPPYSDDPTEPECWGYGDGGGTIGGGLVAVNRIA